jgi:hypothetical protein
MIIRSDNLKQIYKRPRDIAIVAHVIIASIKVPPKK